MGFGAEIKRLRTNAGHSADLLANKLGIPKDRYNKWEQRDIEKLKFEDAERVKKLFGMSWQELIKLETLPPFKITTVIENKLEEPEIPLEKSKETKLQKDAGTNRAMDTLYSLAESNKILVETNAELAGMLKSVFKQATVGVAQDNSADVLTKLDVLLEVIAEVGSGKKWHSKDEALSTLGKRFYADSGA